MWCSKLEWNKQFGKNLHAAIGNSWFIFYISFIDTVVEFSSDPSGEKEVTTSNYEKLENIANDMYNTFRASTDDIAKVANITGWDIKDIEQIKNHMFNDELKLDDGVRLLDPDYEMAVAWQRLIDGQYYENDILLMKHEFYEANYYKLFNCTQREAHDTTNLIFDWYKSIECLN